MQPYGSSGIGVQTTQLAWNAKPVMPESLANQIKETLAEFIGKEIINILNLKGSCIIYVRGENNIMIVVEKLSELKGFSKDSKGSFSYHGYCILIDEPQIFEFDTY
jgi:hypothetical protein